MPIKSVSVFQEKSWRGTTGLNFPSMLEVADNLPSACFLLNNTAVF